jgi:hypothetical protein
MRERLGSASHTCIWLPVVLLSFLISAQAAEPLDYQVKAAFLLNFAKFVEWPPSAFPNPTSPMEVCILGADPFGTALDQIVDGETVNARQVVVQRITGGRPLKSCNVLFIGSIERQGPKLLSGLDPGMLTVGDSPNFLHEGGMIAFVLEKRRVRFDVNLKAAENAGFKISSKLLNVARSVER